MADNDILQRYEAHKKERAAQGIPPLPLNASQTGAVCQALADAKNDDDGRCLYHLLTDRVPPGVDDSAKIKAEFLYNIARGDTRCALIDRHHATTLLGTMIGGYNVQALVALLDSKEVADAAADALANTLLVYDALHDVHDKAKNNNAAAKRVLQRWADATWFTDREALPPSIMAVVFRVDGEINTDDLSPASEAWSRSDIPLHAQSMLQVRDPKALSRLAEHKQRHQDTPIVFVGDVVGTGSSRKSAINSLLWHTGEDIAHVPNKRGRGLILGGKIAPIFFNTAEDSGALPIECDVGAIEDGMVIRINTTDGRIEDSNGKTLSEFMLKPSTLPDEVRAGGRIPLIIGRGLTDKARELLGMPPTDVFVRPSTGTARASGKQPFTLAQKMVGRACGVEGVLPGTYCEPRMTTVGSQDTTGPMTRDELKDLACLGFSADLVMQSFCHTAAYPREVDVETHRTLPKFMIDRGGVSLRPGDGIIHTWINRMLLPDTVGTGADSHTRFPIGISFPAGSGLVAFAAATGSLPLDMPESVLVRFHGEMQPGVTLRDLVHAVPYVALQKGLLTLEKRGKKNVYSGRIMEIEGLPTLKIEQAFEFADASAERSSNGCTVLLDEAPIVEYLRSNITLLKTLIAAGYEDKRTLARRIDAMEQWLANPTLLRPDAGATYAETVDINMNDIKEPLLACPNDPDDIKSLSEVAGDKVDEVFIGSCMMNIGHYRAAASIFGKANRQSPLRLWIVPPSRMDEQQLVEEGIYSIFGRIGARTEVPGCSLCMGNQARVADGATVVSTSTRNFPNRMGKDANVYLASAEVSAVTAILGRIPTLDEYRQATRHLAEQADRIYRYLNFDQLEHYVSRGQSVSIKELLAAE